jgi:hypothetical protein
MTRMVVLVDARVAHHLIAIFAAYWIGGFGNDFAYMGKRSKVNHSCRNSVMWSSAVELVIELFERGGVALLHPARHVLCAPSLRVKMACELLRPCQPSSPKGR